MQKLIQKLRDLGLDFKVWEREYAGDCSVWNEIFGNKNRSKIWDDGGNKFCFEFETGFFATPAEYLEFFKTAQELKDFIVQEIEIQKNLEV